MIKIFTPFTPDQVESLNAYQKSGALHPFTSNNGLLSDGEEDILVAKEDGWHSLNDPTYTQDWAWDWMADWTWEKMVSQLEDIIERGII